MRRVIVNRKNVENRNLFFLDIIKNDPPLKYYCPSDTDIIIGCFCIRCRRIRARRSFQPTEEKSRMGK